MIAGRLLLAPKRIRVRVRVRPGPVRQAHADEVTFDDGRVADQNLGEPRRALLAFSACLAVSMMSCSTSASCKECEGAGVRVRWRAGVGFGVRGLTFPLPASEQEGCDAEQC